MTDGQSHAEQLVVQKTEDGFVLLDETISPDEEGGNRFAPKRILSFSAQSLQSVVRQQVDTETGGLDGTRSITGTLTPIREFGWFELDSWRRGIRFSSFGSSESIETFTLTIYEMKEEDRSSGTVSHFNKGDGLWRELSFIVLLDAERFSEIAQALESDDLESLVLSFPNLPGFYEEKVSRELQFQTAQVKILEDLDLASLVRQELTDIPPLLGVIPTVTTELRRGVWVRPSPNEVSGLYGPDRLGIISLSPELADVVREQILPFLSREGDLLHFESGVQNQYLRVLEKSVRSFIAENRKYLTEEKIEYRLGEILDLISQLRAVCNPVWCEACWEEIVQEETSLSPSDRGRILRVSDLTRIQETLDCDTYDSNVDLWAKSYVKWPSGSGQHDELDWIVFSSTFASAIADVKEDFLIFRLPKVEIFQPLVLSLFALAIGFALGAALDISLLGEMSIFFVGVMLYLSIAEPLIFRRTNAVRIKTERDQISTIREIFSELKKEEVDVKLVRRKCEGLRQLRLPDLPAAIAVLEASIARGVPFWRVEAQKSFETPVEGA